MQDASHKLVIVARTLLPAGLEALEDRFEVKEGGIDSTREQLLGLVPEANALISDPTVKVDDELLDAAGDALMIVANFAVGHDNIDLEACRRREVVVTNTPNVLIQATAELALALTLATARRMSDAERELREGRWRGWDPGAYLGIELSGATVGVVGMGGIGRRYSRLVKSLGAQVVPAPVDANAGCELALEVLLDQPLRPAVLLDERHVRGPTAERLDPDRARAGVRIEKPGALDPRREHVEERLAQPVRRRAEPRPLR